MNSRLLAQEMVVVTANGTIRSIPADDIIGIRGWGSYGHIIWWDRVGDEAPCIVGEVLAPPYSIEYRRPADYAFWC